MKRKKRSTKGRKSHKRRKLAGAALAAHRRKRSHHKRSHKRHRKNPAPRRRRRHHAAATHHRRRRHHRRNPHFNPKKRHHRRRTHRRNPAGGSLWMQVLMGAGLGLLAGVGGAAVASKVAPGSNVAKYGVAGAGVLGGILLAKKRPILGASIAAGSLFAGIGSYLTWKLEMMLASPSQAAAMHGLENVAQLQGFTNVAQLQGVYSDMSGVYSDMSGVVSDDLAGLDLDPYGTSGWNTGDYTGA